MIQKMTLSQKNCGLASGRRYLLTILLQTRVGYNLNITGAFQLCF